MCVNLQVREEKFLTMKFLISLCVSLLLLISGESFTVLAIQKCDEESPVRMIHI